MKFRVAKNIFFSHLLILEVIFLLCVELSRHADSATYAMRCIAFVASKVNPEAESK